MKADISAHTFRPSAHFAAVVVGQGQALVDSAINEQEEIARHRVAVMTGDVVGPSGVPKETGGFAVSVAPDGRDLLVSPGRIYVDGILCVNEPRVVAATVDSATAVTVDVAAPDGTPFAAGQWVDVSTAAGTTRAQLAGAAGRNLVLAGTALSLPAAGERIRLQRVTSLRSQPDRFTFDPFDPADPDHIPPGACRVELDVWYRHITPIEDPSIREVALGDAESATRLKAIWQLRLVPAGVVGGGSCATGIAAAPGQLLVSTVPGAPSDDPCVLPDEAGYRGLENQLYRVEVHSCSATEVVLKWQRDNASTASRVLSLGTTLLLEDMGPDDERGFGTAPYVEVTDDALELDQHPSDLVAVLTPDRPRRTLTLAAAPAAARLDRRARARRWDGRLAIDPTSPTASQPLRLERGVQVVLLPGALRPGDYWLIPARTSNSAGGGTIGWPTDDSGVPLPQPPQGIEHHRAALALVDTDASVFLAGVGHVRECRTLFPPLTAIAASDVSVDPAPCGLAGVSTVQQAIDALCSRGGGLCTATATPGPGWETVFDDIAAGADARICFPVGSYPMAKPVQVTGKGHLVLSGAGLGATLVGTASATVLSFDSCASVTVESLAVESPAAPGTAGAGQGLAGALTFVGCADVTVRGCRISNGAQASRRSSCLRVTGGNLRVEDTRFEVGDRQVGLLAVDAVHTVVSGSRFVVASPPGGGPNARGTGGIATATAPERQLARRLLISNLSTAGVNAQRVGVTIGGRQMSFETNAVGKTVWPSVLLASYPTMRHFQKAIDKALRGVFAGHPVAGTEALAAFIENRILGRRVAVMSQAIVVGGTTVGDVRITSNIVEAAIQGVHIGASNRSQPRGPAHIVGPVSVTDNTIQVVVPPEGALARHAVFIGNTERLRITGNDVRYESLTEGDRITSDGIRVFGFIGRFMVVRENVVDSFPGGITLHLNVPSGFARGALSFLRSARMWAVEDNLIIGASPEVTVVGPLRSLVKFRGNRPGPPDN